MCSIHPPMRKVYVRMELVVFLFLLFVGFLTEQVLQNEHAMLHNEYAVQSAKCVDGEGEVLDLMQNPDTGRLGIICQDKESGLIYVLIVALTGAIVTAFCKQKMRRHEQVKVYMRNRGYEDK